MKLLKPGILLSAFLPVAICQNPAVLRVEGLNGTTATLTAGDLAKLPHHIFQADDHGNAVTFEGVLLPDILARVDTPTGEKYRSTAASYYVAARAKDGYRAVFAWAEVDPTFTDRKIYVVTMRDGKPLAERDGPFETVVPGEKRASRWVRQVTLLSIQQVAAPSASVLPLPRGAWDAEKTRWVTASLNAIQSIQPGMTRADLLRAFTTEGGISNRLQRRYVFRECPYLKVNVEFAAADTQGVLVESPRDRITRISQPFLEWSILD